MPGILPVFQKYQWKISLLIQISQKPQIKILSKHNIFTLRVSEANKSTKLEDLNVNYISK